MTEIATTKMSSKGQVVIPEAIREKLKLKPGTQFIVLSDKDALVLKKIQAPNLDQFKDLIAEARKQAIKAGLKRKDIKTAIKTVRGHN